MSKKKDARLAREAEARRALDERESKAAIEFAEEALARQLQEREDAFRRKEAELRQTEVNEYAALRTTEEQAAKTIAPQFADYIGGNSIQEVERSIELAKQKTAEILAEVTQHGRQRQTPPRDDAGRFTRQQQPDADYTDLSFEDYVRRVRPQLGIGQRSNSGILG